MNNSKETTAMKAINHSAAFLTDSGLSVGFFTTSLREKDVERENFMKSNHKHRISQ